MAITSNALWLRILVVVTPMAIGFVFALGAVSERLKNVERAVAMGILPDAESRVNSLEFKTDGLITGTLGDRYTRTEAMRDQAEIKARIEQLEKSRRE